MTALNLPEQDYIRLSQVTTTDLDSEHFESTASDVVHMALGDETPHESDSQQKIQGWQGAYVRFLALLCACSLTVGSH